MKYLVYVSCFVSQFAYASVLEYKSSSAFFKGEKSEHEITLQTSQRTKTLKITKCNKALVEKFWAKTKSRLEKTRSRGPANLKKKVASARVDGQAFTILRGDRGVRALNLLPEATNVFLYGESKKCR